MTGETDTNTRVNNKRFRGTNKMNASTIINDNMTLEEKLAAIDAAMADAQIQADQAAAANGMIAAPLDPADLTMCEGCQ